MMEEDSFLDCEDEVDEDLEAMLYSQVHFEQDDTADQETTTTDEFSVTSTRDTKPVFTVTPMRIDHSTVSSKSAVRSSTASEKQPSILFESVPFDNEGATEFETSGVNSAVVDIKNESAVQEDASFQIQTPNVVYLGKSKVDKGGSDPTHHKKPEFDMETELGIHDPSPQTKNRNKAKQDKDNVPVKSDPSLRTKKENKAKQDKDTLVKSSTPKFPKTGATVLTPDFHKIDKHSPIKEKDYRQTLNRLLTKKSPSKKVKDVVVIKSDNSGISDTTTSTSSSNSESEPSSDNKICESSSVSDSESDVEILGSASADRSVKKSAEPKLDLNWNVTPADRQTIERIEKESSQEDDSKWKIDDADVVSSRLQGSRYYAKKEMRCRNCDREGHLSKACPVAKKKPNCGLCGMEGHLMQRCKKSLCFNCSQPGHRGFDCPLPKRDRFVRCARCQMKGHAEDQCPDHWRQYHLTVTSSEDLTPRRKAVNSNVYCCNCAKRGHFAHECRRDRMDKFNFPTSPLVIEYDCASSKGRKDPSQIKSAYRESEHGPGAKKFKSDHHHSTTSEQSQGYTPMYPRGGSQGYEPMYPRGSSSSGYRSEPGNQRYYSAQSSTLSTPHHHHHTPTSHRFSHRSEKVGQKMHSTVSYDQQHETPRRPYLSPYTNKFLKGFLQEDLGGETGYNARRSGGDQYFDWQGEQSSHRSHGKSGKRGNSSTWDNDGPTLPKKKKRRKNKEPHTFQHDKGWAKKNKETHTFQHYKGWAKDRKKRDKQQRRKGKTWGERNRYQHTHQGQAEDRKNWQHKSQQKTSLLQPGTSNQQRESLTVTCRGGFRTTVKTMSFRKGEYTAALLASFAH